jgi:hypothetical protein
MAWLLGPLLFICGAGGGFSPKRVMRMEWDGGETPYANMAILDKDGGRGGVVTGGEISAAGASDQAVR